MVIEVIEHHMPISHCPCHKWSIGPLPSCSIAITIVTQTVWGQWNHRCGQASNIRTIENKRAGVSNVFLFVLYFLSLSCTFHIVQFTSYNPYVLIYTLWTQRVSSKFNLAISLNVFLILSSLVPHKIGYRGAANVKCWFCFSNTYPSNSSSLVSEDSCNQLKKTL